MNWVLILIFTVSTSQQIGPYASSGDCEKAFTVLLSQPKEGEWSTIREHYCVPRPYTSNTNAFDKFPEEFD
ncbi:hypothetical protein F67_I3_11_014 [Rhizobium phage RHph_I3_11]|nr:hypothetical protein F67_I3_11_014 [Rhizobium phage RHph_I3_11]